MFKAEDWSKYSSSQIEIKIKWYGQLATESVPLKEDFEAEHPDPKASRETAYFKGQMQVKP